MPVSRFTRRIRDWAKATGQPSLVVRCTPDEVAVIESSRTGRPRRLAVRCDAGESVEFDAVRLCDALRFGDQSSSRKGEHVWSPFLQPRGITGGNVQFEGCGYGHGAGMCQYGAEAHARAGESASRILAWYYPGAEVHAAWSVPLGDVNGVVSDGSSA